jgi:hypothetical protein
MVEGFWARLQVELLNRRRWKTRIELASAIHDDIERFHNTPSALSARHTHPAEVEAHWLRDRYGRGLARTAATVSEIRPLAAGLSDR